MADRCIGLGRIFGHSYEARFDTKETSRPLKINNAYFEAEEVRRLLTLTDTTYRHDICTRCGHVVAPSPVQDSPTSAHLRAAPTLQGCATPTTRNTE